MNWYVDDRWETPSNTLHDKETPRANFLGGEKDGNDWVAAPEWANFGQ